MGCGGCHSGEVRRGMREEKSRSLERLCPERINCEGLEDNPTRSAPEPAATAATEDQKQSSDQNGHS